MNPKLISQLRQGNLLLLFFHLLAAEQKSRFVYWLACWQASSRKLISAGVALQWHSTWQLLPQSVLLEDFKGTEVTVVCTGKKTAEEFLGNRGFLGYCLQN